MILVSYVATYRDFLSHAVTPSHTNEHNPKGAVERRLGNPEENSSGDRRASAARRQSGSRRGRAFSSHLIPRESIDGEAISKCGYDAGISGTGRRHCHRIDRSRVVSHV